MAILAPRLALAQTSTPTPSPSPTSSATPTATPTIDPSITPFLTPNPIHTPLATPTPYPTMTPWPTATPLTVTNIILPAPFTYTDVITNSSITITISITSAPVATPVYIYIIPTPYPTEIVPLPASTPVVCAPRNPVPVEGTVEWVTGIGGSKQGQKYPFQAKVLALSKKDIPTADWDKYIYAYDNAISELIISTNDPLSTSNAIYVIYHFQMGVELIKNVNETASDIKNWWRFDEIRKEAVRAYKADCGKFTVSQPDPVEPIQQQTTCALTATMPVSGEVVWVAGEQGGKKGGKYLFQAKVLALSKKNTPITDQNKYFYAYDYAISEIIIYKPDISGTNKLVYHFQLGVEIFRDTTELGPAPVQGSGTGPAWNPYETIQDNMERWWRFSSIRKEAVRLRKSNCGIFTITPPDPIEPEEVTETIDITLTDYLPSIITMPQLGLVVFTNSVTNTSITNIMNQAIGTSLSQTVISITNFFTDCSTASGDYNNYSFAARMLPQNDRKGINGGQIIELAIGDKNTNQVVYYFVNGGIVNNTLGSSTNAVVGTIVAQATAAYTAKCPTASLNTPGYFSLNGIVAALLATNILLDFIIINTEYISAEITCLESTNSFTLTLDPPPADPIWTGILEPVGQYLNFFKFMGVNAIENAAQQGLCDTSAVYSFSLPFPFSTTITPRYSGSTFFSYASYFYIFKSFLLFTFDFIRSQYWLFKTNLGVVGIFIGWLFMMLPFVISARLTQALIRFLVGMFNFLFGLAGFAYYLIDLSVNVPWAVFDLLGRLAEWFLAGFWFAWLFVWRLWDFAIESWEAVPDTAQMFLLITGGITGMALILFAFIQPIAAFLLQLAGVILGGFIILAKALGF